MIEEFIEVFKKPSIKTLMVREIDEATRLLLKAQRNAEYWEAEIAFNKARIDRLTETLEPKKAPAEFRRIKQFSAN